MKAAVLGLVLVLAGCHVGPQIANLHDVRSPAGAELQVSVELEEPNFNRTRYRGELLSVDATEGILLAIATDEASPKLTWIRWPVVHEVKAVRLPSIGGRLWAPGASRQELIDELRLVSRFPQGLSDELRSALLLSYPQNEFAVIPGVGPAH